MLWILSVRCNIGTSAAHGTFTVTALCKINTIDEKLYTSKCAPSWCTFGTVTFFTKAFVVVPVTTMCTLTTVLYEPQNCTWRFHSHCNVHYRYTAKCAPLVLIFNSEDLLDRSWHLHGHCNAHYLFNKF